MDNSEIIYGIRCISTDEIYINHCIDHEGIEISHFSALNSSSHHCKRLLNAWVEHGEDEFLFVKIESSVSPSDIGARMLYWTTRYEGKLLNSNKGPAPKRVASARLLVNDNFDHPQPTTIRAAREAVGLTMQAAGRLIHIGGRMWGKYETGAAPMHKAYWELFIIKSNQVLAHWDTPTDK